MERGRKQICSFLDETIAQLTEPHIESLGKDDLIGLLQKSIALLCSVSEYSEENVAATPQFATSNSKQPKRTRGPEIALLADELWRRIVEITQSERINEDLEIFRKNHKFLISLPDYKEHLLETPNAFALLPTEIAHDVIAVCDYEWGSLKEIQGSWGEFCQSYIEKVRSEVHIWFKDCKFQSGSAKFTLEEAQKHYVWSSVIDENVDFTQLRAVAPSLYDDITFYNVPDIPSGILPTIGSRFTRVEWLVRHEADVNAVEIPFKPEVIDFFKRQLRSKHLRSLKIAATGINQGELDELLVDFVKRPHFENLELYKSLEVDSHRGVARGGYPIPFGVIEEVVRSWNSRTHFAVNRQSIKGSITQGTYEQLEHFEPKILNVRLEHEALQEARMNLMVRKEDESWRFEWWCVGMLW